MLKSLIAKLAGLSSLTWLQMLPWALLGVGIAVSGAGAFGWHEGAKVTAAGYEAEKEKAAAASAEAFAQSVSHAADVSMKIMRAATDSLAELNLSRQRRVQIVQKVTDDAKANVSATCVVPAATVQLRKQQVDESAAIAAQGNPM